jgi:uncharacterized protein YjbJ (UPF0337 family)
MVKDRVAEGENLYGQAKDAARDATDAAVGMAKDAYENSGETLRDGSQAVAKTVQDNPLGRCWSGDADDASATPPVPALALLQLN